MSLDEVNRVSDEEDGLACLLHLLKTPKTLALKPDVANRKCLIHDQDVGVGVNGCRKCQADIHAT